MSKVVGLELGFFNTNLVLGQYNNKKLKLLKYKIIRNNEAAYAEDGTLNLSVIAPTMIAAVKQLGGKGKKCHLTIDSDKIIVRKRYFPMVGVKELDSMVKIEADQILPYDVESFYIDYKVVSFDETEDNTEIVNVMFVAIPKEIVDSAIDLVDKCGMKLVSVNVFVDSITSFKKYCRVYDFKNVLIVDVDYQHLRMIAFREGRFFANINSDKSIKNIVDYYSKNYGLTEESLINFLLYSGKLEFMEEEELQESGYAEKVEDDELETIKFDVDAVDDVLSNDLDFSLPIYESTEPKNVSINKLIDPITGESIDEEDFEVTYTIIINEINKMLDFYNSRGIGNDIEHILLSGCAANAKGLLNAIQMDTGINTSFMTCNNLGKNKDLHMLTATIGGILRR